MSNYDDKAAALQNMTRESEDQRGESFSDDKVKRAQVYSREDLVLVVSHLSSINDQLRSARGLLVFIVILLAILLFKIW